MELSTSETHDGNWLARAAEQGPVMVVSAHPDDETLGVGGHLSQWPDVYIVHLTDGSPRSRLNWESYAAARRDELWCALKLAGVSPERRIQLGAADQETADSLLRLSLTFNRLLLSIRPAVVLCHSYEGGHPDHDSAAFIVQAATNFADLWPSPMLAEYTSYHNAPPFDGAELRTGHFLPGGEAELEIELTPEQQSAKRRMLDAFVSQQEMIANFPVSPERFRLSPKYDFNHPPHPGSVYYDQQGWGIQSCNWRRLAAKAQAELGRCSCPFTAPRAIW